MSEDSSEDAQEFESQLSLDGSEDPCYISERDDSGSTLAAKVEPSFTIIEVKDLETIQASDLLGAPARTLTSALFSSLACCSLMTCCACRSVRNKCSKGLLARLFLAGYRPAASRERNGLQPFHCQGHADALPLGCGHTVW